MNENLDGEHNANGVRSCPTCGSAVVPGAELCSSCGLPLPPPVHFSTPMPWYIKALIGLGILWLMGVAWYTVAVELPEARRSQSVQDHRYEQLPPATVDHQ